METTLFEIKDQYDNSLKDFNMNVDYELAYLTTTGDRVPALSQVSNVGSAMYNPDMLPQKPANFKCLELTTRVQCEFYTVDQNTREIYATTASDIKIPARKKKITQAQRVKEARIKSEDKLNALLARLRATN